MASTVTTTSTTAKSSHHTKSTSNITSVSYESFAPRSSAQLARLARIAELTAGPIGRVSTNATATTTSNEDRQQQQNDKDDWMTTTRKAMIPPSIVPSTTNTSSPAVVEPKAIYQTLIGNDEYDNNLKSSSFFSKEDAMMVQETMLESERVVQYLGTQLKYTTTLKMALQACNNITNDISNQHGELMRHSGELSAAADQLQQEEQLLSQHAHEIGVPLQHYDTVDRIGISVGVLFKGKSTIRGLAKIKVDSDEFPTILQEIDNAIIYFGNECGGKEALQAELKRRNSNKKGESDESMSGNIEYYRRAMALQEAALDQIKEAVDERIRTTSQQIAGALNLSKGNVIQADQLEASLIYTRFHGISSRSNRLLSLLKERCPSVEDTTSSTTNTTSGVNDAYQELLQTCRQTYCSCRESLLRTTIRTHMDQLKDKHGPVGMTRLASVFLIRLCTIETAMYLDFFGKSKTEPTKGKMEDDSLKGSKSRGSQQQPISDDTAYKSAEFQSYLTSLCSSLHRTVRRALVTMSDLDSLCQIVTVLREERSMASVSPTTMAAARAITSVIQDAQERLIFCANSTLQKDVIKFHASPSDLNYPEKLRQKVADSKQSSDAAAGSAVDDDIVEQQLKQVYESWFPPIRTVLKILSKIFRVVETRVFEDMALQSVRSCTKCLKDGAEYIKSRQTEMDADLFLVKHFLILREQLSPFDIELRSVERQLDFSDAGKAVARFLANRNRRVFSVSTENALVTLLREGVSVQEASVDSKRDLEDALRSSCNDFIEHTAHTIAPALFDTIDVYKSRDDASSLLTSETILSMLASFSESIESKLTDVKANMSLYLDNTATQSILLKPVSRKITRALEEIRKLSHVNENGWDDATKSQVIERTHMLEETLKAATKSLK